MKKQKQSEGATKNPSLTVPCPSCGKASIYSPLNPVRPFCSDQCKTGDLAAWASDEYAIPTKELAHSRQDEHSEQDSFES